MHAWTDESDRAKFKEAPKKIYDSDDLDDDSDDQETEACKSKERTVAY
jgi:hypothetical protein